MGLEQDVDRLVVLTSAGSRLIPETIERAVFRVSEGIQQHSSGAKVLTGAAKDGEGSHTETVVREGTLDEELRAIRLNDGRPGALPITDELLVSRSVVEAREELSDGNLVGIPEVVEVGLVAVTAIMTNAITSRGGRDISLRIEGAVVEGATEGHVVTKTPGAEGDFLLDDTDVTAAAFDPPEVSGRRVTRGKNEVELGTSDAVGGD
jgi:hypothetical protein